MLCIILEYLDADDWADNADLDQTVLRRSLIGLCSVCLYATSQLILLNRQSNAKIRTCFVDFERTALPSCLIKSATVPNLLYCASYVDVTVFVARTLILEQTLQTLISWSLGTGRPGSAVVADRILFSESFSVNIRLTMLSEYFR